MLISHARRAMAAAALAAVAAAAWAPNLNANINASSDAHGRALLSHEFLHSGTFCMGSKMAPVAFLLGCPHHHARPIPRDRKSPIRPRKLQLWANACQLQPAASAAEALRAWC